MKALTICGALGLLIISGFFSSAVQAEVQPAINYIYFKVPYLPGKSVIDMITISSPLVGNNGHKHIGLTRWRIKTDGITFTRPKIGVCRVEDPRITCTCEITLPQLEGGDDRTRREFEKIAAETKEHELEHCRIAVKHANEMEWAFKEIKDYRCDEMSKPLQEIFDKIHDDCVVEQKRFDHAEYGYSQYLYLESLQRMQDAGFNVAPPTEGRNMPTLDRKNKSNLKDIPQGVEDLKQEGIYKDENGVWRNY